PDGDLALAKIDPLKYQTTTLRQDQGASSELLTLKLRYKEPDAERSRLLTQAVPDSTAPVAGASENLRFAAAVAECALLLRASPYKGDATYEEVTRLASQALGADREAYRSEFLQLVTAASRLPAKVAEK